MPKIAGLIDARAPLKESALERKFRFAWERHYPHLSLEREYVFAPPRKFRSDFAHLTAKVLIEVEGGTFAGGRHSRGVGYNNDCEKYNLAAASGWLVFRLADRQLSDKAIRGQVDLIAETICKRTVSGDSAAP